MLMPFASLREILKFQTHSAAVLVSELDSGASISILHFAIPARASCAGMTPTAGKLATTATVSIASSRLRVPEGRSSVHEDSGRAPWTICRSDASPKCRRDSCASVSSARIEVSGAGRTLSLVLAAI